MSGRGRGKRGAAKAIDENETPVKEEKPKKTTKKKQFPVVAVVGPDGIEGNLLPEARRPLIVHLPIQSKDVSMNDMPHLNKSYSPQPEVVYIDFHKYIFEKATKNEITFADKKQRLNRFKRNLTNLRTTKKAPLPNNVKGLIGSYISGLNKKSLKNQDAALKKHIKALEKNLSSNKPSELLRGGTRKRRFKSSKRKTT